MASWNKKEPRPDQKATASSNSRIPKDGYGTSARRRQEKVQRMRDRLKNNRHARVPGHIIIGDWGKQIGPAWRLLLALLCLCDWETGVLRTYEWVLAELLDQSERNIRKWIRRLEIIHGFEVVRLRYGIEIHLPDHLIPNRERNKNAGQGKYGKKLVL